MTPGSRRRIVGLARSAGAGRAGWGVVDQGVSSLTNFAVTLAAARQAGPGEFGAFSVALASFIFLLWVARSLVNDPFIVRFTSADRTTQHETARDAVGTAVVVGAASTCLLGLVGVVAGNRTGALLWTIGPFLPALLAQDAYRHVLLVRGDTRAAASNDSVWFAVQAIFAVGLFVTGHATVAWLVVAFGTGAVVAAAYAAHQTGVVPRPSSWRAWYSSHRDLAVPFAVELVAVSGMSHLTLLGIALIGEVVAVGELRAAVLLFSPLTVLFSGLLLVAMPEAVRLRTRSVTAMRRLIALLAVSTAVATVVWAAMVAVIPAGAGDTLLRSNWLPARRLLVAVAVLTAATACSLSAVVGLRALQAASVSLRARAWAAPVTLISGLAGAKLGNALGATVGLAAAAVFCAVVSWIALARAIRAETGLGADVTPEPAPSFVV